MIANITKAYFPLNEKLSREKIFSKKLYSEHALLIRLLSQVGPALSQKSFKTFNFLNGRARTGMHSKMESSSEHTVLGHDMASFIRGMAQEVQPSATNLLKAI